ncbi:MAG TPA: acetolactate synthase small subunit [Holophaga sp.]|nr:acetolactate synthase small subunit [Holophaga sp.]
MQRILVALTDNEPGVLDRVASIFRRRGYNIHSLTVSPTLDPEVSRITLVTDLDDRAARAARSYLERLVNVHSVEDFTEAGPILRDTALIRVAAGPAERPGLFQLASIFRAEILEVGPDSVVLACCDGPERIRALVESLRPYGLLEFGRTGVIAVRSGGDAAASFNPAASF